MRCPHVFTVIASIILWFLILYPLRVFAADTTVETSTDGDVHEQGGPWGAYWIDEDTATIAWINADRDMMWRRTTDGGSSWGSAQQVESGEVYGISCWFDQETPGDTGTLMHCVWPDRQGTDALHYVNVDISDGTESSVVDAITITVNDSANAMRTAITKTQGGNLIACISTQSGIECSKSDDTGATWSDIADAFESATEEDWLLLYPADTADTDDAAGIFWDRSADEISVKMYDDSANTWTETSISTAMVDDQDYRHMDGAIRLSDQHLILAAHNDADSTTDDIKTWDITLDSISSPTVTAKTDVVSNQSEAGGVGVFINQQNDDVYVAYYKGNTAWLSTVDLVYHISEDDLSTWGSEQSYNETTDDYRSMSTGRTVDDDGGYYQPLIFDDDNTELIINLVNDVAIAEAAGPGGDPPPLRLLTGVGT